MEPDKPEQKNCPVTNNTKMPIYVGADMIPPGETRHFYPSQVPEHLRPVKATEPAPKARDELAELSEKAANDIIAAIPGLSDENLTRLEDLEHARMVKNSPAARKTILSAISEETLDRADRVASGGGGREE